MATEEELQENIRRAVRNGRIDCGFLLDLAGKTQTPPEEIGRLCNEMNLRISNCRLGCFPRDS